MPIIFAEEESDTNVDTTNADNIKLLEDIISKNKEKIYYALFLLALIYKTFPEEEAQRQATKEFSREFAKSIKCHKKQVPLVALAMRLGATQPEILEGDIRRLIMLYINRQAREQHKSHLDVIKEFKKVIEKLPCSFSLNDSIFAEKSNLKKENHVQHLVSLFAVTDEQLEQQSTKAQRELNNDFWLDLYKELNDYNRKYRLFYLNFPKYAKSFLALTLLVSISIPIIIYKSLPEELPNSFGEYIGYICLLLMLIGIALFLQDYFFTKNLFDNQANTLFIDGLGTLNIKLQIQDLNVPANNNSNNLNENIAQLQPFNPNKIEENVAETETESGSQRARLAICVVPPFQNKRFSGIKSLPFFPPTPTTKLTKRPELDENNNNSNLSKNKLKKITFPIAPLKIEITFFWDEKTGKVYQDEKGKVQSKIQQVPTRDRKKLFSFIPQNTILEQANKQKQQGFFVDFNKQDLSTVEDDLRKLKAKRRTVRIRYNGNDMECNLVRERIIGGKKIRLLNADFLSTTNEKLSFSFIYLKEGLHEINQIHRENYGTVELNAGDIADITTPHVATNPQGCPVPEDPLKSAPLKRCP